MYRNVSGSGGESRECRRWRRWAGAWPFRVRSERMRIPLPRAMKTSHLVGIGILWIASIAYGICAVRGYESTPGATAAAPANWPIASGIPRKIGALQLVMFVHPKCSCTRASLEELSAVLTQLPGPVSAWIVIEDDRAPPSTGRPVDPPIAHLAHVTTMYDSQGAEAHLFGAHTSGHIVLYDAEGTLQFSGGITGARGHVGDNWGLKRLIGAAKHPGRLATTHFVYGCPL
jgi:hypothetical protein